MLQVLSKATGHTWKTMTLEEKSVAILFDFTKLGYRTPHRKTKTKSAFGHGAVLMPFYDRKTGIAVDVASLHVRPKSIATPDQKKADVIDILKLRRTNPAIFAGDYAGAAKWMTGWTRSTPNVDTMDDTGNQYVDAAFRIGATIKLLRSAVINPGSLSDHKWLRATFRITVPSTTN